MKAAYIDRFGGPEVLQCGDLPDPSAAAGQVVVDVAEASVNGADWRVRAGQYGQATFPLVLGRDLSGSVAALGAGVGDRRARSRARRRLRREACDQRGDHRQETRPALARRCGAARAHRPLGHHQRRRNELQRGETILIHGGAGGVASFAIRLAKQGRLSSAAPGICLRAMVIASRRLAGKVRATAWLR
jgi:NADPH:quinone reductase-like Zn-dependent oxidoreductase